MIEWTILLGALAAVFGAVVGVGIRRVTMFLYPYDFLSIIVYTILIMLVLGIPLINALTALSIWRPPVENEVYLSWLLGYLTGYCLDGRRTYDIVKKRVVEVKTTFGEPWVTYKHSGVICLAVQTNRALYNRLVKKIHVPILANAPYVPDWTDNMKYPLLPPFIRRKITVEDWKPVRLKPLPEDLLKKRPPVRTGMLVNIAHGSQVSIEQLCYEADAVRMANEGMAVSNRRLIQFTHYVKTVIPRILTNFLADTYNKSPVLSWIDKIDHTKAMRDVKVDEKKIEHNNPEGENEILGDQEEPEENKDE